MLKNEWVVIGVIVLLLVAALVYFVLKGWKRRHYIHLIEKMEGRLQDVLTIPDELKNAYPQNYFGTWTEKLTMEMRWLSSQKSDLESKTKEMNSDDWKQIKEEIGKCKNLLDDFSYYLWDAKESWELGPEHLKEMKSHLDDMESRSDLSEEDKTKLDNYRKEYAKVQALISDQGTDWVAVWELGTEAMDNYALRYKEYESNEDDQDTSALDESRERADELAIRLGVLRAGGKVKFFDEERELSDDGYMFALMEIPAGENKMWVVFYPNDDCNTIVLVFSQKTPWNILWEIKTDIDEFYDGDEGELYGEEDDCPAYVWEDGSYDEDEIRQDLVRAAEADSDWVLLSQSF